MSFPSDDTFASFQTSAINNPDSSGCNLSPAASAFSAILSAFIGSVINGLTNGYYVAFMTGWISWFAIFRVLVGGAYLFYRSITDSWGPGRKSTDALDPLIPLQPQRGTESSSDIPLQPQSGAESSSDPVADENVYASGWQAVPAPGDEDQAMVAPEPKPKVAQLKDLMWPTPAAVRLLDQPHAASVSPTQPGAAQDSMVAPRVSGLNRDVTALGWLSLAYTVVFAPITQVLFVAANASRHDVGPAKLVRGLTVAITALPLCVHCRVRYADSLPWGRYGCNLLVSLSCLLQGVMCATLLITGLLDVGQEKDWGGPPLPAIGAIYTFGALIWMVGSFAGLPMKDAGSKGAGSLHWAGYILDVGMGAFAGAFLAAPALGLYSSATFANDSSGMKDLEKYFSCESQVWRKFAAVAP